jgi:hypothetical protein
MLDSYFVEDVIPTMSKMHNMKLMVTIPTIKVGKRGKMTRIRLGNPSLKINPRMSTEKRVNGITPNRNIKTR